MDAATTLRQRRPVGSVIGRQSSQVTCGTLTVADGATDGEPPAGEDGAGGISRPLLLGLALVAVAIGGVLGT